MRCYSSCNCHGERVAVECEFMPGCAACNRVEESYADRTTRKARILAAALLVNMQSRGATLLAEPPSEAIVTRPVRTLAEMAYAVAWLGSLAIQCMVTPIGEHWEITVFERFAQNLVDATDGAYEMKKRYGAFALRVVE